MKNIAKFVAEGIKVYHFGQVKTLPEHTVLSTTDNATVCRKVNPVTRQLEDYAFAKAYFSFGGERQQATVAVNAAELLALPDVDSSKKAPGRKLGSLLG